MALRAPKVRDDLEYFEQQLEGEDVVVVRDPIRSTYFRFNPLQAAMLRALDGERNPLEITQVLAEQFEVEIPEIAAERFISRARELMLLELASHDTTPDKAREHVRRAIRKAGFRLRSPTEAATARPRAQTPETALFDEAFRQLDLGHPRAAAKYLAELLDKNPANKRARQLYEIIQTAFIKSSGGMTDYPTWVIFNPGKLLTWLSRTIGRYLFGPIGIVAILAFLVLGGYAYTQVSDDYGPLGAFDIVVCVVFILLGQLFHELGHGFACQHYGGNVTEIGIILFYNFKPAPFCDTSSSYLITNRKHKVVVQLAGTIASLIFLSGTSIALALLSPEVPVYPGIAIGLVIASAFSFLTLWPLLKLDGYYAISDWTGFPNLRDRAFKLARAFLAKRLLGLELPTEDLSPRTRKWLIAYGIAARTFTACFVLFLYTRIILGPLVGHFRGPGLLFAIGLSAYLWRNIAIKPVVNGIKLIVRERRTIFTLRRTAVLAGLAAALIGPWFVRWPLLVDTGFEVRPHDRAEVRARTAGRVDEVLVREGDRVRRDQPLARMHDARLEARIAALRAERELATHRIEQVRSGARPEELALAQRRLDYARAEVGRSEAEARTASQLASAAVGTAEDADAAHEQVAATSAAAGAAKWQVSLLAAGAQPEEIAAADAELARLDAELAHLATERALWELRSPIDGVVATPHLQDKLQALLAPGDLFAEIHDDQSLIAELPLAPADPLAAIHVGDEVVLRPEADPGAEVHVRVDRFRLATQGGDTGDEPRVIAVTSPFTLHQPVTGLSGHARIYGEEHSLAYAYIYEPVQRLVRVRLWSMW